MRSTDKVLPFFLKHQFIVALIFGWLGFIFNFIICIPFESGGLKTCFFPGLVFPLCIAIGWGWRHGLLSAILGLGCQSIWFWMIPWCGWAALVSVPMYTAWIFWHGWWNIRRHRGRSFSNPYFAEILFRLVQIILLYSVYRWAFRFNPPSWAINSITITPDIKDIQFVACVEIICGFLIVLLTDVLFQVPLIRKLFGLDVNIGQKTTSYVVTASVVFGLVFWVVDGMIDYYKYKEYLRFLIFKGPDNILDSLIFNVSVLDLFGRTLFIMTCLVSGLLVARFLGKHLESAEAQKASEIRYRRLHETMRDAFVQMDLAGKITDFNSAFQQMLKYPFEELLGMEMCRLTPENWHALDRKIVEERVLTEGQSDVYEKEIIDYDGKVFPVNVRLFLIKDDQGKATSMWAIVRDITERKNAEKEREQVLEALRRSNEDLQQFAYVASHDLQEPLRMVSSYTYLLSDRYGDQLDDKARKYIGYAVEGAVRMQNLIQDLLAYSRVDTRGTDLVLLDLNTVFQYAKENLHALITETNAGVTADFLPMVEGDESQLVAVFQNLIHNGIKFRGESIPKVHITAQLDGKFWLLGFNDNGIGIDEKYKDKIFIIFQRLHARNEYSGTGIGLALCKRIIERHRGNIWFDSLPGKGSTFFVSLPALDT